MAAYVQALVSERCCTDGLLLLLLLLLQPAPRLLLQPCSHTPILVL